MSELLHYFLEYQYTIYLSIGYLMILPLIGYFILLKKEALLTITTINISKFSFLWVIFILTSLHIEYNNTYSIDIFTFIILWSTVFLSLQFMYKVKSQTSYLILLFVLFHMLSFLFEELIAKEHTHMASNLIFNQLLFVPIEILIKYLLYIITFTFILLFFLKPILLISFDKVYTQIHKINIKKYEIIYYMIIISIIFSAMRSLGEYLTITLLFTSSWSVHQLTLRWKKSIILILFFSVLGGLFSFIMSFIFSHLVADIIFILSYMSMNFILLGSIYGFKYLQQKKSKSK